MILVMMPFFSSKNLALTASQPPKVLSIVNSSSIFGNGLAGSLAPLTVPTSTPWTDSTGRKPYCA